MANTCSSPKLPLLLSLPCEVANVSTRALDLLSWSGGRLSDGVQRAIYHGARRRGLNQSEIADLVDLSRSHFANLLSGRFGASAESAARIRDFLIDGALTVGGPS